MVFRLNSEFGRIADPPDRFTLWRYEHPGVPVHREDLRTNCGGAENQWIKNRGKCGYCGDPYTGPRKHEFGGKYFSTTISRNYSQNSVIYITAETPSKLRGWFEFSLYKGENRDDYLHNLNLMEYKLKVPIIDKHRVPVTRSGVHVIPLELPRNVTCQNCFIQWKLHTDSLWGCRSFTDPSSCCVGCGDIQEEMYGCIDISISPTENTDSQTISNDDRLMYKNWWCSQCQGHGCDRSMCYNENDRGRHRRQAKTCQGAAPYANLAGITEWCNANCNNGIYSYCPPTHCQCTESTTTTTSTTSTTTTPPTTTPSITAPGIVRVLGNRGCEYCKNKNDDTCKDWYCFGYEGADTLFEGDPDRVMITLGIQTKCSLCKKINDTDCSNLPECLLTEPLSDGSDGPVTDDSPPVSTSLQMERVQTSGNSVSLPNPADTTCKATGDFAGLAGWDKWCEKNCDHTVTDACYSAQLPSLCLCEETKLDVQRVSTEVCVANGPWAGSPAMDDWCATNCALNNCPASHCICSTVETTTTSTTTSATSTSSMTTPTSTTTPTTTTATTTTPTTTTPTTTTPSTTTPILTTTTTIQTTTTASLGADVYSLNAMNGVLCDICNNNQSVYSQCSQTFCDSYNPTHVLTYSPELFCGTPGKDSLFCEPTPMVQEYILSATCAACIYLSPNQDCTSYCNA
ncbi:hypothetical protein FSP39_008492 [Pinctada imbricata]|uniref:Chitin-binding type-4 domain-containing protein n=1 Tax=Pinctada imbricata TaxID=66713 RepID=A0AA88YSH7_PINIB|nr:hypothetical protein FSP39_008492 [Pinctada imbricata]